MALPLEIQQTWDKDGRVRQSSISSRFQSLCWQYIRRRPAAKKIDGALFGLGGWWFRGRHPEGRDGSLVWETSTRESARSATVFIKLSGRFAVDTHWMRQRPKVCRQFT